MGGWFSVVYDEEGLVFQAWEPAVLSDTTFSGGPHVTPGQLIDFSLADVENGITGLNLIGTLTMSAAPDAPSGTYWMSTTDMSCVCGPWITLETFQIIPVEFDGTNVHVKPVPLPTALWLFGVALVSLMPGGLLPRNARR